MDMSKSCVTNLKLYSSDYSTSKLSLWIKFLFFQKAASDVKEFKNRILYLQAHP